MENYLKTRNTIVAVCNQSGLSLMEICGVLSECLADVRDSMLSEVIYENDQLKAQLVKAAEEKKTKDQKQEAEAHE